MTNSAIPFDKHEYWAQRFEHEASFEWLLPWSVLEPQMRAHNLLPEDSTAKILNLGCGNSDLPLDLYRSGYRNVTSVDFVASVIDRMRERCERAIGWQSATLSHETKDDINPGECPLQFLEMDCLDMSRLPEQSFQLCFDKSTSDAISCGDDDEYTKLRNLCVQVARVVTRPSGLWCVVSYSKFRQFEWTEGPGRGLWRTEQIVEIKTEQHQKKEKHAEATHKVFVPDVHQFIYVNRRL
ncbi:hypothetical protein BGZ65_007330 [Modicella reniformis]|uniref:Methyltransferase domain-containing protein n=1 Tax=Modicella reniformis TaxID=1440133 RepID=A0A9P6SP42_9FUNG|nr:hypothetical protein BGZ65_007330 [Modicella reniformis]